MAGDAGRVSVFLAVAAIGLFFIVGVTVDGSGVLRTMARADNIAAEAARAAGQGIDLGGAAAEGQHRVAADRAAGYAEDYLATAFARIDQEYRYTPPVPIDDGNAVEITVILVYEPQILRLFGMGAIPVEVSSTALLITG